MNQILPGLYREGIAVSKEEKVIGYIHYLFVQMVRDDDSFGDFMRPDEFLHHLDIFGSDIGKRFVQYAEFGIRVQNHIHFCNPYLSPGQLAGGHSLICMELIVEGDKTVIIDSVQLECFTEGHIGRDEHILRKILDPSAYMTVICFGLIIETDEYVLRLYSAHNAFEETGLSAAVPAEHSGHSAGLRSDEGTLEHLQFVKFQMYAVNKKSVNGLHFLNIQ